MPSPVYPSPKNFKTFTLDAAVHPSGINAAVTAITVNESLAGLAGTGYLTFDRASVGSREIMKWTNANAGTKTFTVVRGSDNTTATTHALAATIALTPNAAYFDDLKSYVDGRFAYPLPFGSSSTDSGAFTTLAVSGATNLSGQATSTAANQSLGVYQSQSAHTSGTHIAFDDIGASTGTGSQYSFSSARTASGTAAVTDSVALYALQTLSNTATIANSYGVYHSLTVGASAAVTLYVGLNSQIVNSGTVSTAYGIYLDHSGGTVTSRYLIADHGSVGGTQGFLKTDYAISTGIFSNSTAHTTKAGEIKMYANGTVYYIPIYT